MFHDRSLRSISKDQVDKKKTPETVGSRHSKRKACPHSICEDLSAHRKAHFGHPALICQTTCNRFCKILAKLVGLRPTNISKFFHPVNDDLGMNTLGAYSIPCECSQVYVGQTGRSIATRVKENYRYIRLRQPDQWAVPERI
jgi:hypothetical protein